MIKRTHFHDEIRRILTRVQRRILACEREGKLEEGNDLIFRAMRKVQTQKELSMSARNHALQDLMRMQANFVVACTEKRKRQSRTLFFDN